MKIISRISLLATIAACAMMACKSNPTGGTPVTDTELFTIKAGAYFQFLDYTADSTTHLRDTAPATIIRRHIVSTGLSVYGKTSVAMAVDSHFSESMTPTSLIDTTYFYISSDGKSISQYGFVAGLVKQYSGGLVSIPAQWNQLVSLTASTWTTDNTNATINGFQVTETTTGKNMDTTSMTFNGVHYLAGEAAHSGSAQIPTIGLTVKIDFTVIALFDPTAIASIVTKAAQVGAASVPEHHRVLTSFSLN